ncbi:hypothetical protein T11_11470 [Trichinella zimbabwensis]|uniref:Uncharacterized protein n=1 Tax=Trichinella zimbabwensis TaxID=268475 RepID=A0A0V1I3A6_9BILA|nr:hypothetical protein T11_11470 [Trichinella zimbabwensis]
MFIQLQFFILNHQQQLNLSPVQCDNVRQSCKTEVKSTIDINKLTVKIHICGTTMQLAFASSD